MSEGAARGEIRNEILLPPEHEGGVYASLLSVWHSPSEFTLDFAALREEGSEDPDDAAVFVRPYRVVSRIRLPVSMIFVAIRELNDAMTAYERLYGEITVPVARSEGAA